MRIHIDSIPQRMRLMRFYLRHLDNTLASAAFSTRLLDCRYPLPTPRPLVKLLWIVIP